MATDEEAQQAISMLNERDFGGRNLTVNEARPKVSSAVSAAMAATATTVVATAVAGPSRAGRQQL